MRLRHVLNSSRSRVPHVSHLRHGFYMSALLMALVTIASMPQAGAQSAPDGQKQPWQIGSPALMGKQEAPVIFVSPVQATVAAGKSSVVDLRFHIADGLHINSHRPHDANLIPTQILVADSTGLNTTAVDFPVGTDTAFAFAPNEKLNVYAGDFSLHAHITAKPGTHTWQGVMRYQACDNSQCLPPRKVPVSVDITAK